MPVSFHGDMIKIGNEFKEFFINTPGDYELGTGKGVSVNQLIQMVEQISGKNIKIEDKPFILEEADNLVAKNSPVENPILLEDGIRNILKKLESELK